MKSFVAILLFIIMPIICLGQNQQKLTGLTLSLPWANNYYYYDHDLNEKHGKSGFFGLGAAIYHLKDKYKYSLNIGLTGDLVAPIGPLDYAKEGTRSSILAYFIEGILHRKLFSGFNIVGGVNYLTYNYNFTSYVDSIPSYNIKSGSIGLTIGPEFQTKIGLALALFYRPTLYSFRKKNYQHHVSLDLRYDINFKE